MHVETRIDQTGKLVSRSNALENIVIERIVGAVDDLGSCRMVDVDHGGNTGAPFRAHIASNRHVTAGTPGDVRYIEDPAAFSLWITGANGMNSDRASRTFSRS